MGNLKVLKVSYAVWVVVPFLTRQGWLIDALNIGKWQLAEVYFATVFLAIANLVYDLGCPPIIKRFASPNDLYSKMLEMRALSVRLYPEDQFRASYSHCESAYLKKTDSGPRLRAVCSVFFVTAAGLFAVILVHRSYVVLGSLLPW